MLEDDAAGIGWQRFGGGIDQPPGEIAGPPIGGRCCTPHRPSPHYLKICAAFRTRPATLPGTGIAGNLAIAAGAPALTRLLPVGKKSSLLRKAAIAAFQKTVFAGVVC
jgi:hypothetical protein